jgi:predicted transposase/invertase (TIGR01784 family)
MGNSNTSANGLFFDIYHVFFERIIYVLKHMDVLKRMPWVLQDSVFKRLSEIAEVASLNKEERKQYDESLRHYRDTLIVMEGQYMEGEKKGRAEGRAEEKLNNARSLKKNGVPIDLIAKSLGLTTEEIEAL